MYADYHTRSGPPFEPSRRRGVVLILILAMLSIVALIGVTFVSFSGQAQLGARSYALGQVALKTDAIFDFAISQLINDTNNPKSAIRGHSLLRDMYGNDATTNGYLTSLPSTGLPLSITNVTRDDTSRPGWSIYTIATNIAPASSPSLYGANYTGTVLRLQQWLINATTYAPITPILTIENQYDAYGRITHTFEIVGQSINGNGFVVFQLSPVKTTEIQAGNGPTLGLLMPEYPLPPNTFPYPSGTTGALLFEIDGRYQRGFNGSGISSVSPSTTANYIPTLPGYPNFLFNGPISATVQAGQYNDPNLLPFQQLDEDYDAPDLENLFMGLISADGQVVIPSFHRPELLWYDPTNAASPQSNDWLNYPASVPNYQVLNNIRRGKFLRPRAADHPTAAAAGEFPDLIPDPLTGKITYDVDNDGDGITDSVWLDLGFPVQHDASGKLYKPLFSFLVLPLNGRLPLNTAGNLERRNLDGTAATGHAAHLGNSPSEIDPRFALRNPAEITGAAMLQVLLQGNPNAANGPEVGRYGEVELLIAAAQGGSVFPRAGRSYANGAATGKLDGLDSNFNTLDFYPQNSSTTPPLIPERGNPSVDPTTRVSGDLFDAIGRVQLPSERFRRFVTPIDPTGNGLVVEFDQPPLFQSGANVPYSDHGGGFDQYGRVSFFQYFRPPGVPGDTVPTPATPFPDGDVAHNTLNLYHGFESQRNPIGTYFDLMARGPDDVNFTSNNGNYQPTPINLPTFDGIVNSTTPTIPANYVPPVLPGSGLPVQVFRGMYPGGSLVLHDPEQLDLYRPNNNDAPFEPKDLEWLYRQGDIDSSSLDNRLARLLPDTFLNPNDKVGSAVRRRLFSDESWELNTYVSRNAAKPYAPPISGFPITPTLMHGGHKINLNYPLPYSNSPTEPTRQKWCQDAYQFLADMLYPYYTYQVSGNPLVGKSRRIEPARGMDATYNEPIAAPPERLAELSQFVVNIIDFRDPDAAMTRFVNPELTLRPAETNGNDTNTNGVIDPAGVDIIYPETPLPLPAPLVQYGMEYPPIALNEVLGFQTIRKNNGNIIPQRRLFIELANLLTKNPDYTDTNNNKTIGTASDLDLNGWGFIITKDNPAATAGTAPETIYERPNILTGQLSASTVSTYFVPIGGTGVGTSATQGALTTAVWAMDANGPRDANNDTNTPPNNNYYVLANTNPPATDELNKPEINYNNATNQLDELVKQFPNYTVGSGNNDFYWLHLLRPANPLNPGSAKVVVDSIRFPYVENGVSVSNAGSSSESLNTGNEHYLYAVGRLQPYRGGHDVPTSDRFSPAFPYGYSEQVSTQDPKTGNNGQNPYTTRITLAGTGTTNVQQKKNNETNDTRILHTLGEQNRPNESPWDHLAFHDRDFTSVAELLMVPNCPPALFTKIFAEDINTTPQNAQTAYQQPLPNAASQPPGKLNGINNTHAFPYLSDAFFYTNFYDSTVSPAPFFGQRTVGWHRMLEYFEVPSPMFGAIGPAAQGQNADWYRRDVKPGLMNINTIVDEEVFAGLMADDRLNILNAYVDEAAAARPYTVGSTSAAWPSNDAVTGLPTTTGVFGVPRVVSSIYPTGIPSFTYPVSDLNLYPLGRGIPYATAYVSGLTNNSYSNYMKAAFSDFLKLRHGGSGLVFSPYATSQPIWTTPNTPAAAPFNGTQNLPDRPYRALSSNDIYDTLLRPARLYDISDRFDVDTNGNVIIHKPGRRPETLQIPTRRLFQIPDEMLTGNNPPNDAATFDGSPFANDATPFPAGGTYGIDHVNLYPYAAATPPGARPNFATPTPDQNGNSVFLGANTRTYTDNLGNPQTLNDRRRHPYFRTEWLQKLMNLTTVRSHQYAVWVTVGLFEVVREGNTQMVQVDPTLALDELGPEVGRAEGRNVRHRAFYIIDRTRATGFDPANPPDFRNMIIHQRRIE